LPTIRTFNAETDYSGLSTLFNAHLPDEPTTPEGIKARDANRPEKCQHFRWIAERDGELIGVASGGNTVHSFHPQHFFTSVIVHPEHRRNGLGTRLYEQLCAGLAPLDPIRFFAFTREDRPDGVAFLAERDFVEEMREWESRLSVADFDRSKFAAVRQPHGIEITNLATLIAREGEAAWEKFYALEVLCDEDVPRPEGEENTPLEYDAWRPRFAKNPDFRPEAFSMAVAENGDYAGVSMLFHPDAGTHLNTGLTGVHRAYRRRGIALALKLRAIDHATVSGATEIRTENATSNVGMLAINEALGFIRQPAGILFSKRF
jgi:mycothiol synthase